VPLLPLLAAALIAAAPALLRGSGDAGEPLTAGHRQRRRARRAAPAAGPRSGGARRCLAEHGGSGEWLRIGAVPVRLSFMLDAYSLPMATLVALIAWIALRFLGHLPAPRARLPALFPRHVPVPRRHAADRPRRQRGAGLRRLGTGRHQLLAADRLRLGTTRGDRQRALRFLTNRVGDAGFLLGIGLAVWSVGTLEWAWLPATGAWQGQRTPAGGRFRARGGGQVGAVAVHAVDRPCARRPDTVVGGVLRLADGARRRFLLCRLQGLLLQVPDLLALLAVVGLATALYGGLCALVQSDVKSALIFSTVTQVGLMFFCCGLGLFWLAACYSGLHAAWRAYQFLLAPAYMHLVRRPARPVPRWLAPAALAVHGGAAAFLDRAAGQQPADRPTLALGRDVRALDERFIDPLVGAPRADESHTHASVQATN
jgi:hypothetical protein